MAYITNSITDQERDRNAIWEGMRRPFKCPSYRLEGLHPLDREDYAAYWRDQSMVERAGIGLTNEEFLEAFFEGF